MEKKQDKTIILGIGVFFLLMGIVIFQVLQRKLNSDPLLSGEVVINEEKEKLKKSAQNIYEKVGEYGLEHDYKTSGIMFDFSLDKSTSDVVAGNTLNYEGEKATSGKLYLDVDGTIQTIENLKIGPYYCINEGSFICNGDNNIDTGVIKYKDWNVNSIVTLADKSKWVVVSNNLKYSKNITLASVSVLDINSDKKINEDDMIPFDTNNKLEYKLEDGNVSYQVKKYMDNAGIAITDSRLMTTNEINTLKNSLTIDNRTFWIHGVKDGNIATYKDTVGYQKATDKAYVRPVITISKDQIVD